MRDSNPRHPRCKHGALPTELIAQVEVPPSAGIAFRAGGPLGAGTSARTLRRRHCVGIPQPAGATGCSGGSISLEPACCRKSVTGFRICRPEPISRGPCFAVLPPSSPCLETLPTRIVAPHAPKRGGINTAKARKIPVIRSIRQVGDRPFEKDRGIQSSGRAKTDNWLGRSTESAPPAFPMTPNSPRW